MAQKRKIRIVNKTKLLTSAAILLLCVILLISLVSSLTGNKIQKEIEKLEGKEITILDARFESSLKNKTDVDLGETVTFKLVYYYQTEDKQIRSYSITEDIEVAIKGATEESPSTKATVYANSVTISTSATAGDEITVILSHKYAEDAEFTFVVKDSEYIE